MRRSFPQPPARRAIAGSGAAAAAVAMLCIGALAAAGCSASVGSGAAAPDGAVPSASAPKPSAPSAPVPSASLPSVSVPVASFFPPAGTVMIRPLGLLASAPAGTASLPWQLVAEDAATRVLLVDVLFGGCDQAPEGYTVGRSSGGVTLAFVGQIESGFCNTVREQNRYQITLPAADATPGPGLRHAPVSKPW
jgi:hypothetical protein